MPEKLVSLVFIALLLAPSSSAAQAGAAQLYSEDFEHATSSDLADVGWTTVLNAGSGAGLCFWERGNLCIFYGAAG